MPKQTAAKRKPGSGSNRSSSRSSESSSNSSKGRGGQKRKKTKRRGSGSDDESRERACKFNYKHDDKSTDTIFWQLASQIPWLHTRNGQKTIWRMHLSELQSKGHALELQHHKDALKTFIAWAANICKQRRSFRLQESRTSGLGTAMTLDNVDDVVERWDQKLVDDGDVAACHQEKADIMRDAMCNTAQHLDAKTAKILQVRKKRYASKKFNSADTTSTSTPSKSSNSVPEVSASPASAPGRQSPATDARASLLSQLNELTKSQESQAQSDAKLIQDLSANICGSMRSFAPAAASAFDAAKASLKGLLETQDPSLVAYADVIHSALGISDPNDFTELTVDDINNATGLPLVQRKRLVAVARRFGVQS